MNSLNINQEETIDAKWKAVKDAIKTATVTVIGKQNRTRKPWFNNSCKEAFNRRKEARTQMLNNPYNREKVMAYKECQKEANNIFRYEKRKYTKDVLEEAEIDHKVNRTRQLYQKINSIRGGHKKHEKFLKNDDGSLVTEQDKVLEKWRQYFGLLLNCENPVNTFAWMPTEPNDTDCPLPSKEEILQQLNRLKNHKTPGEDGIQGEVLKNLDDGTINRMHSIIESIWHEERLPEDWGTALVCPIHKKNDPQECSNYRGIALLDTTYKVLAYCILDRVRPIAETLLGDYQGGFSPNRSTTDQIFVIRQILQKSWEYNKDVHILFPSKIVSLIGASINQTDIKVKIANTTSQPVRVTTGLRQGDALSPVLFNLLSKGDDIETIKRLGKKLIKAAEKVGLSVNDDKTEYLIVSRNSRNHRLGQHIELEGHIFKKVSQFKYLGSIITQDNELKTEVSSRIQLANKGYYGLEKVLKSRTLSKNLKIRMYMTLLRPIVMYGSETWALRKAEEQRLGVFERKVLRKIYGPVFDNQINEWRKLHNYEIQMQFQRPDIIKEITKRRLMWGGHAWRKQESLVRLVIEEEPIGKRPLGRPRLRWEDCVKKDIKSIGPGIRWREVAEDRDRCYVEIRYTRDEDDIVQVVKPQCWDLKQVKYFSDEYPWLFWDASIVNGEVYGMGDNVSKQQANLRKKICKHRSSKAHKHCEQIIEKITFDVMPKQIMKLSNIESKKTEFIFRTAYYIAKNQRPYSDMPKLIDL
ncbi:uncharacterized protein LOC132925892 [Rhopalosiphum padi]|uniref:uncharacterized protein LOC132925892 n=1 Tax=Rhopalosiphum padi TaxID=40932 RepID=UPI00298E51E8|nr:uncharacterized protein LOC132925892 [Rhopalosiphum padi]